MKINYNQWSIKHNSAGMYCLRKSAWWLPFFIIVGTYKTASDACKVAIDEMCK